MRAKPHPAAPASPVARLHPRNRHQGRYDFPALVASSPELAAFVARNAHGDESIDFADPVAVKALNRALLKQVYGIGNWDIPPGYLCPPIPGRADYLHCLADLLATDNGGEIPRGSVVRALDIGVGANCVYPLIGHAEYGWRFVGTDVDRGALTCAQAIIDANPGLAQAITLRRQPVDDAMFEHRPHDRRECAYPRALPVVQQSDFPLGQPARGVSRSQAGRRLRQPHHHHGTGAEAEPAGSVDLSRPGAAGRVVATRVSVRQRTASNSSQRVV